MSKVLCLLGFLYTSTFVRTGASGLQLKSHAPHIWVCAKSRGFVRDPLSMLRAITTCSNTLSHRLSGKLGSVPHRIVIKWSLNAQIYCSAALRQWMYGGAS